jgi:hypothetical protein
MHREPLPNSDDTLHNQWRRDLDNIRTELLDACQPANQNRPSLRKRLQGAAAKTSKVLALAAPSRHLHTLPFTILHSFSAGSLH